MNKIFNNILDKFKCKLLFEDIFAAFCASFCLTCISVPKYNISSFTEKTFVQQSVSISRFVIFLILFFLVLMFGTFLVFKNNKFIKIVLIASSTWYGMKLCTKNKEDMLFCLGVALVIYLVVNYVYKNEFILFGRDINKYLMWGVIAALTLYVFGKIAYASVARYTTYSCSNFDFGIFAQMFEKMRTTGLPNITVERNELMSHFGVHFSPSLYLLLPFYCICPRPETILVLQALVVVLGVIPLTLICKHFNFTNKITVAVAAIYLFYPTLSNAALTDFHENKLLSICLMWCIYFMLNNNRLGYFIAAVVTLGIKEDAALYVIMIGIYALIVEKKKIIGIGSAVFGTVYFIAATKVVEKLGKGVMISRLGNYIPSGEEGFISVAKNCFFNFGYLISQVFTTDKMLFALVILLPLGFAPFMCKKKTSFILIVPMLVINLMPNWEYQYDINYQYTCGVVTLLIFLLIVVVKENMEINSSKSKKIILFSVIMTLIMFNSIFITRSKTYTKKLDETEVKTSVEGYNELISTIPKDASVTANCYYIPHMYDFDELYMYPNYYSKSEYTDYLIVSRVDVDNNISGLAYFIEDKYDEIGNSGNMVLYKLK